MSTHNNRINRRHFLIGSGLALAASALAPPSRLFAADPSGSMFRQMHDALSENLGLKHFQLIGTPKDFVWNPDPVGQMDPSAYQVISGMPLWSPVGRYASKDARLFDAVHQVWGNVRFKVSPEQAKNQRDLQNECNARSNAVTRARSDMNQAYLSSKQNGGLVFAAQYPDVATWLEKSPEGAVYNEAFEEAAKVLLKAIKVKTALEYASMPNDLQRAIDAMHTPEGAPADTPAPAGWVKVADNSGIIRWQPEFKIETTGSDWRANLTAGSAGAFTIALKSSDDSTSYKNSFAGGSAGHHHGGFVHVSGPGGWEKTDLFDKDSSVNVTISAKSSTRVKVDPGAWYPGGFLSELAKAKQGDDSQGYTIVSPWVVKGGKDSSSIFGQYGLVSTRVSELLVVYKPSFEITMGASTYEKTKEKFETNAGIRIGPLSFGGPGGGKNEYKPSTSKPNTFSGESTSDNPQIIGVLVAFPGTDKA